MGSSPSAPTNAQVDQLAESIALEAMRCGFESHPGYQFNLLNLFNIDRMIYDHSHSSCREV